MPRSVIVLPPSYQISMQGSTPSNASQQNAPIATPQFFVVDQGYFLNTPPTLNLSNGTVPATDTPSNTNIGSSTVAVPSPTPTTNTQNVEVLTGIQEFKTASTQVVAEIKNTCNANKSDVSILLKCNKCSFKTKSYEKLQGHLLVCKGSIVSNNEGLAVNKTFFQCENCSFNTKYKFALNFHLLTCSQKVDLKQTSANNKRKKEIVKENDRKYLKDQNKRKRRKIGNFKQDVHRSSNYMQESHSSDEKQQESDIDDFGKQEDGVDEQMLPLEDNNKNMSDNGTDLVENNVSLQSEPSKKINRVEEREAASDCNDSDDSEYNLVIDEGLSNDATQERLSNDATQEEHSNDAIQEGYTNDATQEGYTNDATQEDANDTIKSINCNNTETRSSEVKSNEDDDMENVFDEESTERIFKEFSMESIVHLKHETIDIEYDGAENCALERTQSKEKSDAVDSEGHEFFEKNLTRVCPIQKCLFESTDWEIFHSHLLKDDHCPFKLKISEYESIKRCKECDYITYSPHFYRFHCHCCHSEKATQWYLSCFFCGYGTLKSVNLVTHMLDHHFAKATNLTKYPKHIYEQDFCYRGDNYSCNKCTYTTAKLEEMEKHRTNHGFLCTQCPYYSKQKMHLTLHTEMHNAPHKEFYICKTCVFATYLENIFIQHCLKKHSCHVLLLRDLSKRFPCSVCSFSTDSIRHYHSHQRSHSTKRTIEPTPKPKVLKTYMPRKPKENHQVMLDKPPIGESKKDNVRSPKPNSIGKPTNYKTALNDHLTTHQKVPNMKILPSQNVNIVSTNSKYIKNKKADERFCCANCPYKTKRLKEMMSHYETHKATKIINADQKQTNNTKHSNFKCATIKNASILNDIFLSDVVKSSGQEIVQTEESRKLKRMSNNSSSWIKVNQQKDGRKILNTTSKKLKFSCTKCEYETDSVTCMQKHKACHFTAQNTTTLKNTHNLSTEASTDQSPESSWKPKKMFVCHNCKFETNSRALFHMHEKMHKLHESESCDNNFTDKGESKGVTEQLTCSKDKNTKDGSTTVVEATQGYQFSYNQNFRSYSRGILKNHKPKSESLLSVQKHKTHICEKCELEFDDEKAVADHMAEHHDQTDRRTKSPDKCINCNYVCKSKEDMKRHLKSHSYYCTICVFKTSSKRKLQSHIVEHQTGKGEFTCSKCPFIGNTSGMLIEHELHHSIFSPNACKLCGLRFFTAKHLRTHLDFFHKVADASIYMETTVDSNKSTSQKTTTSETENKPKHKSWNCTICPSKFLSIEQLKEHEDMHEYRCNLCMFITKSLHIILRHRNLHIRSNGFKCQMCSNLSFNQKSLLRHYKFHASYRKHMCTVCKYRFESEAILLEHQEYFHNVESIVNYGDYSVVLVTPRTQPIHEEMDVQESEPDTPSDVTRPTVSVVRKLHFCKTCKYKTNIPGLLVRHEKIVHQGHSGLNSLIVKVTNLYQHPATGNVKKELEEPFPQCSGTSESNESEVSQRNDKEGRLHYCHRCKFNSQNKYVVRIHQVLFHVPGIDYNLPKSLKSHHKKVVKTTISKSENSKTTIIPIGRNKCKFCDYSTNQFEVLLSHMKNFHKKRLLRCHLCPFFTNGSALLANHLQRHERRQAEQCPECSYSCARPPGMQLHMQWHKVRRTKNTVGCYTNIKIRTLDQNDVTVPQKDNIDNTESCNYTKPSIAYKKHVDGEVLALDIFKITSSLNQCATKDDNEPKISEVLAVGNAVPCDETMLENGVSLTNDGSITGEIIVGKTACDAEVTNVGEEDNNDQNESECLQVKEAWNLGTMEVCVDEVIMNVNNTKDDIVSYVTNHAENKFTCLLCDFKTNEVTAMQTHKKCHQQDVLNQSSADNTDNANEDVKQSYGSLLDIVKHEVTAMDENNLITTVCDWDSFEAENVIKIEIDNKSDSSAVNDVDLICNQAMETDEGD